ncbi:DUF262 domain-containing protein [Streptomyces glaucus]|uniref:GmrSD restriction endonucleases N-terminal domain-containing protein n=1 Tax=Streptomyces glaucus TaxID=284029 RepID=A0ABP5WXZ8_9ACTN
MLTRGLLANESLDLVVPVERDRKAVTQEDIVKKYTSGDVRIVTEQARTQLPELPSIISSGRYELQPEYQRRRRWSKEKQSRLIESFIMNVPVPPIFLYEFEYARYEVMDGLQRLTALADFYSDDLVLTGLEYWSELDGMTYSSLPLQIRQGIDRRYLSSIVLLYETARDDAQAQRLKELVFERINTGGISLSSQEQRNAASRGPLNKKLAELARTPSFCQAWGIPEPDERELSSGRVREEVLDDARYQSMEDIETVLRFFAHRQRTSVGALRNMRIFLDRYWQKANSTFSEELVDELGRIFVATMDLAYDVLGERVFYIRRDRPRGRVWVPRPTLLAYDCVMSAFSQHLDDAEKLRGSREEVNQRLEKLYDDHKEDFDGRRTDPQDVQRRDELISDMLKSVVSQG